MENLLKKFVPHATIALIIFNVIDAILSVKYIKFGPLYEINPVARWFLAKSVVWFVLFKIYLVNLFIIFLREHSNNKFVRGWIYASLVCYTFVIVWWGYLILLV